ncbi:ABC transporter permease [Streptacidiphilus jiangxiensis]|uniref:Peptide/nickel transport system permease protein n=1 Tax=Streptacidiphilus jiangxiensis TaxID=235985 RepID=A0A1H7HEL9_STRJI|nr:ABC transporter permease [Streptacidiphilus jiangxiensis]SEK48711.1 peptide/nickel transport system permease protein [Streptacidiphilus jiangxiensis]
MIWRFLARRTVALLATLLVASVVIYGGLFLAPGDPATLLVGGGKPPNPQLLAEIHRQYHLDDPFYAQYWRWLTGMLHGDAGQSLSYHDQVSHLITARIGTTALLIGYATVLIVLFGVSAGVVAGLRGGRTATAVTAATTTLMAVPTFVSAVLLIWLFAVRLNWLPAYGNGTGLADQLTHLTLPAIALAVSWLAYVAQVTRSAVDGEQRAEHVQTARSRGIPERLVVRKHILRNASGPILSVAGVAVAGLIAGCSVVEQTFGLNGVGALLIQSAAKQDLAVVQALALLTVVAFAVVNTLVDLATAALDHRVPVGGAA